MNYTEKYHLPQWEENDRVMRTDFNQMCADIESGLNSHSTRINQAQQAAANAQNTALTHKNYVVGGYMGDGGIQTIELGFRPSFIIVSGQKTYASGSSVDMVAYLAATAGENQSSRISFTDSGFTIRYRQNIEEPPYPNLNANGRFYEYIAFM